MHEHAAHGLALDPSWLSQYGVIGALFLLGLVGSLTHCIGMCGPFVLGQVANRLDRPGGARMDEFARLRAAALLPYHLGRWTTYAALGAVAAGLAQAVVSLTGFQEFLAAMLAIGALLMLATAVGHLRIGGFAAPQRLLRFVRPLFANPSGLRGYGLGLILGLLPCGLVYGALTLATATGSPLMGAVAMAAFGVGTAPMLMLAGFSGALLARRWQRQLRFVTAPLLLLNAATLGYLAVASLA
ncbi:MAG: sulfite exporter TauE/SafE family protein [Reyranellaceae bacterium]